MILHRKPPKMGHDWEPVPKPFTGYEYVGKARRGTKTSSSPRRKPELEGTRPVVQQDTIAVTPGAVGMTGAEAMRHFLNRKVPADYSSYAEHNSGIDPFREMLPEEVRFMYEHAPGGWSAPAQKALPFKSMTDEELEDAMRSGNTPEGHRRLRYEYELRKRKRR